MSEQKSASRHYDQVYCIKTAFLLGMVLGGGIVLVVALPGHLRLACYLISLCVFHFLEFHLTAIYHPESVSSEAFLLNHSTAYTLSILAALTEYAFLRGSSRLFSALGLVCICLGQYLRTRAMIDAGTCFSHEVAQVKRPGHRLITTGIYGLIRHPSYAGFYLWAVGTQLLLGNLACLVGYVYVLQRFFAERVEVEEGHLRCFFPGTYEEYRALCWSGIPFVA